MTTKRIYCRNQTSSSGNKRGERLIQQEESYHEQIAKFYENGLSRHALIKIDKTPEIMTKLGARQLPILMKQSTLRKIIKIPIEGKSASAHGLLRKIVESIPKQLETPIFIVNERKRESLALITDVVNQDKSHMLIAIKLDSNIGGNYCNEIKSIYGKENIKDYLLKQEFQNVFIADIKRAKQLSRLAGLQLPAAWKVLDYKGNIPQKTLRVKQENAKNNNLRGRSDIAKDIRKAGFTPTKNLINHIRQLDGISGISHTMKDICNLYKNDCKGCKPEEKELIHKITQECKKQEMVRAFMPER